MSIEEQLKNEMKFCVENDFVKNDHQQYIYNSTDGVSSINLPFILNDYKDWLIENDILKEL